MAEGKKSFIFYCDWIDTFKGLPKDDAYDLFIHTLDYVNDKNPISENAIVNGIFPIIKNQLKRDLKKWEKQHKQRVEAGKRSAEIRKRNATSVNERSISSTVNVNGNVNVNDNNNKENFVVVVDGFIKQLPKERMWIEGVYLTNGFENGSLTKITQLFRAHLLTDPQEYKNFEAFKKHLRNWININANGSLSKFKKQKKGAL